MKWFKHDTDASTDAKIKKLIIRHGAVGYAIYFHCLELIAGDVTTNKITFELEHDAEIIADNLKIIGSTDQAGVDIVNTIMNTIIDLGLFESSNDKIYCIKLAKRIDSSMTSNPKFRAIIKESHDSVMIQSCKKIEDRRDKKIEDRKEIEENKNTIETDFIEFYNYYGNKQKRPQALSAYKKARKNKTFPDQQALFAIIDNWRLTDKWKDGYQPYPSSWLNSEGWLDELPEKKIVSAVKQNFITIRS